ncbi:MAG: hypothetical protein NDI69_17900, partial [Bacteriovoracaceae bacterium]|nr:hypothetical protein [Bacteriovoracaceae bacterium]
MKKSLILLAAFSTFAFADNWDQFSKNAVIVRPLENANAPLEYNAGDRATFEGDLCTFSPGHLKNGKEECKKLNGNLEMKAYFPDPTVDVTNQVKIIKKSNTYSYSFQTPPLKAGDRNNFTLIVGPMNNHLKEILTIKAKLDRRIDFIEERILKYKLSNK